jgi:hypothetical protein
MTVEINQATEELQIKHKSTGKWSPAYTPLQIDEGFRVSLIENQMQEIRTISTKIAALATLTSSQDIQRSLSTAIQSLETLVNQATSQSANVSSFYQSVTTAVSQLSQLAQAAGTTNQAIASQLTSLSSAISSLGSTLSQSQSQTGTTTTATGATDIFETLIAITTAGSVEPVLLPNTTRKLVFSGRKDGSGKSYDIYWSFSNNNMSQGKYKILWAYNEFGESGLSFKDKTLYLSCDKPIQIDLCAYYSL